FDEQFNCAWHEDSDLQFRLLTEVGGVGFCPDAKVVHPTSDESWGASLRRQRDMYFDALLYKKHPRLYRERIRRVPPWDYYVIALLSIVTPFLWAGEEDAGVAMSVAVVLALVLRLAWRRLQATDYSPRRLLEMLATSTLIPFLSVYWRVRGALRFKVLFL